MIDHYALEEVIKHYEVYGCRISINEDQILGAIRFCIKRGIYSLSSYISYNALLSVPIEKRDSIILDHIQKEIRELDNSIANAMSCDIGAFSSVG